MTKWKPVVIYRSMAYRGVPIFAQTSSWLGFVQYLFKIREKVRMRLTITICVSLALASGSPINEYNCECVSYYLCKNDTIETDGVDVIDPRFGGAQKTGVRSKVDGRCDTNILDVCCKSPDVLNRQDVTLPEPRERRGCGQRNPDGVSIRIHTDTEAQFAEYPWMVAIIREEGVGTDGETKTVYQCGGALIHTRAVLTTAHCVNGRRKQPSQLRVRAGEWDTQTEDELFPYQDREVASIIVHEKFNSGSFWNDVAILILKTPVTLAENVDLVCLPEQGEKFDGSRCIATGWGKDTFGKEGQYSVILKALELPVVPHDACQTVLRTTRLGKRFNLNPSFMCAGGEAGKDTCKGDGGSPLVCPLKNDPTRYAQVGIVSWGIGCGENKIPGVYANVAALREWIDGKMIYNKLDATVYQPCTDCRHLGPSPVPTITAKHSTNGASFSFSEPTSSGAATSVLSSSVPSSSVNPDFSSDLVPPPTCAEFHSKFEQLSLLLAKVEDVAAKVEALTQVSPADSEFDSKVNTLIAENAALKESLAALEQTCARLVARNSELTARLDSMERNALKQDMLRCN